jgi:hypothetical protein
VQKTVGALEQVLQEETFREYGSRESCKTPLYSIPHRLHDVNMLYMPARARNASCLKEYSGGMTSRSPDKHKVRPLENEDYVSKQGGLSPVYKRPMKLKTQSSATGHYKTTRQHKDFANAVSQSAVIMNKNESSRFKDQVVMKFKNFSSAMVTPQARNVSNVGFGVNA